MSTAGNLWGWVEGAPGNLCWSNDGELGFNQRAASEAVLKHNQWLEEQKPLALRIIEARAKRDNAEKSCTAAFDVWIAKRDAMHAAQDALTTLELSSAISEVGGGGAEQVGDENRGTNEGPRSTIIRRSGAGAG